MPVSTTARVLAAATVLLSSPTPGEEAGTPGYLVEYRAYGVALESGDTDATRRHAHAAWQAAEQELGDHRLTAILAYNYGRLVLFTDAEGAHAALTRVRGLLDAGIADLDAANAALYADYAEFVAGDKTRREADRLRASLRPFPLDAPDLNPDLAPMWLRLAAHDAVEERFRRALESATLAETAIRAASPRSTRALAEAMIIQAIAHLVPYPRKVEDVQDAHNDLVRALALFEPQEDIDTFDTLFAQALAWDYAADSALHALDQDEDYPDHADTNKEEEERVHHFRHRQSLDCSTLEWERRDAPRYPGGALRSGYIGAVLVGYRIAGDGHVYDARVLAEVPQKTFGDAALAAVQKWRVREVPEDDPACLRNVTVSIRFMIEN